MAGWFDSAAKRAARDGQNMSGDSGLSRREVLTRGAVVAGVAWTAPMLMATQAAAVGLSACPSPGFICGSDPATSVCCPNSDFRCTTLNGAPFCATAATVGGFCSNRGGGICSASKCNGNVNRNQCNSCADPNVCGGEGAECCGIRATCADGLVCSPDLNGGGTKTYCRKRCTINGDCYTGQVCAPSGFCAEVCRTDNDCAGAGTNCVRTTPTAVTGLCAYAADGGVC